MSVSCEDKKTELDAAAILLSLKSSPPSFPKTTSPTKQEKAETTNGYIPIYDWTQALPTLTQTGNTYNINLQMYNSPVRFVPVPLDDQNPNSYMEMKAAFVKFCQIHKDTIVLRDPSLKPDEINEKLVQLWSKFPEEEKFVYSKVAKNEILLMQGKDIQHIKKEETCSPSLFRHPMFPSPSKSLPPKSPKIVRIKQRSLSLSDKSPRKVIVRRTMSHDEKPFAKPADKDGNAFLIRVRRHSMNDSILDPSLVEKINPYFTKNYSKTVVKLKPDQSAAPNGKQDPIISPPKRKTLPDPPKWNGLKSPPKRTRTIQSDIFDFKSSDSSVKQENQYCNEGDRKITETYSYSLLKGASKTSSVNPSFSSRKSIVKRINSIQGKCVARLKSKPTTPPSHVPPSPTSSGDVTMVTSTSVDSLRTSSSSSSAASRNSYEIVDDPVLISHAISELERAKKMKGGRRSNSQEDLRTKCVYDLFREHGLSPSPEQITSFVTKNRSVYGSKSAALLSMREVKQKILKLQNV